MPLGRKEGIGVSRCTYLYIGKLHDEFDFDSKEGSELPLLPIEKAGNSYTCSRNRISTQDRENRAQDPQFSAQPGSE